MTNQYMNNLYRDLLSNSPQTITIDIPFFRGRDKYRIPLFVCWHFADCLRYSRKHHR